MAWNEPGGNRDKDPWGGNRGNDQGPPDLDEVIKKMQSKFGGWFGGKSSGGSGGKGGVPISLGKLVPVVAGVALLVWALSGIYIVEEGKRGVVLQFGAYNNTTLPGIHWYPRFVQGVEQVDIAHIRNIEVGYRTGGNRSQSTTVVERESLMLTQDENIVDIQLGVQYKVKSAKDYLFVVRDPDLTIRQATESAVREIIGKSKMDFVLTEGRGSIGEDAERIIQEILDLYITGLQVTSVNLQNAQPPEQVQPAFEDAVKAREDEVRLKNEAEAYANDIIPKARGNAARQLEEANAYREEVIARSTGEASRFKQILAEYLKAPRVTRQRLYIESVESVLKNTSKVMIDIDGGNNILFLPLDEVMQRNLLSNIGDNSAPLTALADQETNQRRSEKNIRDKLRSRGIR